METKLRQVKIEEYWPLIVKNTDEFQQIAVAENPEFNKLAECIYRVLKDGFIHDATEYGVERWESILKLTPAETDTLDDRKARILTQLSVKIPYTWRVLEKMVGSYLTDDQWVMEYVNDEGKLVIHTDRVEETKLETIKELLDKVLPANIELVQYNQSIDIPWRDWTPGFTQVEYLESTRTQKIAIPNIKWGYNGKVEIDLTYTSTADIKYDQPFSACGEIDGKYYYWEVIGNLAWDYGNYPEVDWGKVRIGGGRAKENIRTQLIKDAERNYQDGKLVSSHPKATYEWFYETTFYVFAGQNGIYYFKGKIYSITATQGEELRSSLIPALDPTGAPCMFDLVTKTPFYNNGAGDFLYPGKETEATTFSLRRPVTYAQLTEHGVRRLYHVPEGCNMTKDEYAAANGFKELVEPPMPPEGYWIPEWRETDTQLICDWVETEPPTEEETTYEDVTEND